MKALTDEQMASMTKTYMQDGTSFSDAVSKLCRSSTIPRSYKTRKDLRVMIASRLNRTTRSQPPLRSIPYVQRGAYAAEMRHPKN